MTLPQVLEALLFASPKPLAVPRCARCSSPPPSSPRNRSPPRSPAAATRNPGCPRRAGRRLPAGRARLRADRRPPPAGRLEHRCGMRALGAPAFPREPPGPAERARAGNARHHRLPPAGHARGRGGRARRGCGRRRADAPGPRAGPHRRPRRAARAPAALRDDAAFPRTFRPQGRERTARVRRIARDPPRQGGTRRARRARLRTRRDAMRRQPARPEPDPHFFRARLGSRRRANCATFVPPTDGPPRICAPRSTYSTPNSSACSTSAPTSCTAWARSSARGAWKSTRPNARNTLLTALVAKSQAPGGRLPRGKLARHLPRDHVGVARAGKRPRHRLLRPRGDVDPPGGARQVRRERALPCRSRASATCSTPWRAAGRTTAWCRSKIPPKGAVNHTLDEFIESDLRICAQVALKIEHHLMARVPREAIRRVFSHPQVFGQCRQWLRMNLPDGRPDRGRPARRARARWPPNRRRRRAGRAAWWPSSTA